MKPSINISYIRGTNGRLKQPYTDCTLGPNRKERRAYKQKKRFTGNSKNYHLTIVGNERFTRRNQYIYCIDPETGEAYNKTIEHYVEPAYAARKIAVLAKKNKKK